MKKKIYTLALSALIAGTMCSLASCNSSNNGDEKQKQAYVSLDINPAVELIVDKDNNVISVRGENEDGLVLLYEEDGIEGEKIDVAIKKITDLAIKYGYLSDENKVVDTTVSSGDTNFASKILDKVNTSITTTASNLGLTITTDCEGTYSLLRKMDEIKKEFPNNTAIQNMTFEKFKLALSVSETGDISLDAAIELDDDKLIEMLKEVSPKIEEFATESYVETKTKALAVYDQVVEISSYSVYTTYYIENLASHLLTSYYGGVYQMYASAATGFNAIYDIAKYSTAIDTYPLNEAQIKSIADALGMESTEELKNSNGEITIRSIEAYVDKLFKNTPASETLEQLKSSLTEALEQAESVINEKVNEIMAEYKPQIEAQLANTRNILETIEEMLKVLPDNVKTIMTSCTNELKDILSEIDNILANKKIDLNDIKDAANRLEQIAKEYLEKIKNDLTEREWEELEAKRESEIAKYKSQKQKLEETLNEAAKAAKEYLAQLKADRLNNKA